MKTLSTTLEGKTNQAVPQWIEPKVCHYIKSIQPFPITNMCFFEITTLSKYIACRVMFKQEATSVDIMPCIGCGAQ